MPPRRQEKTVTIPQGQAKDVLAHVAERLKRSILTLYAQPDRERGWLNSAKANWPEVVRSVNEAYGYTHPKVRRFDPSPQDVDEYLFWLDQLTVLKQQDERGFRIIKARAVDEPWWRLAQRFGCSERTVRRWFDEGVVQIHALAVAAS